MTPETLIALSLQRALLGAVTPNIRQVSFHLDGTSITLHFIYDGPVSDEDRDDASTVGAEVISDMAPEFTINEVCVRSDYPEPIEHPDNGRAVYLRKEA